MTHAKHWRKKQPRSPQIFPNFKSFLSFPLFLLINSSLYSNPLRRILEKWSLPPTLPRPPSPSTEWCTSSIPASANRMYMTLELAFPPCWSPPLVKHLPLNERDVLEELALVNVSDYIRRMLIRSCW